MTAPATVASAPASDQLPLPGKQFQRFIVIFHVVFLFGLAAILLSRLQKPEFAWTSRELVLWVLVLTQSASYVRFFAFLRVWPRSWRAWAFYFSVNFVLWYITWQLDRSFEWVILAYLGQMFGVLPPRASLPAGGVAFLVYIGTKVGFDRLAHMTTREWVSYLSLVIGWTTLGLFLHNLAKTSSERAKLIEQLTAAQNELKAARLRDAELAVLRERERLARDLHDSLGHSLVTLTVQLEAAERLLPIDAQRATGLLVQMKQLSRTSTEALRRSLVGLRTPGLGDRPLCESLRTLCSEITRRTGLKLECQIDNSADRLPAPVAEALWRVAQEGLASIEMHAGAKTAGIILEFATGDNDAPGTPATPQREVILRVVDDGVGLPNEAEQKPGHFGLRGLRERVEGVGGTFTATPLNPCGTELLARIPVMA